MTYCIALPYPSLDTSKISKLVLCTSLQENISWPMSINAIRKCLDENYDALHLLDVIPSHETLVWVPFSGGVAPTALVIGTVRGRDILAYITQMGDKPIEARYCLKASGNSNDTTWKAVSQDEVMTMKLNPPFKYNADSSKASKRKFSIIIKWYFMVKGLVNDRITGDMLDYCKRFSHALEKIDEAQQAEGVKHTRPEARTRSAREKTPLTIEESPEPAEPKNAYGLRSAHRAGNGELVNGTAKNPDAQLKSPSANAKVNILDPQSLRQYLGQHDCLHLLKNIHEADELQFFDQDILPEALPQKLFLGKSKFLHGEIHAYMLSKKGTHTIELWLEDPDSEEYKAQLLTENIATHTINHPFNKTFQQGSQLLNDVEKERLETLIIWYFISGGVARIQAKDMLYFPAQLRSALEYIAERMGTTAARSSPPIPLSPKPHSLDESHIQSSLAQSPKPSSPRGTKRTAEDAVFEDIHRNVEQDMALTKDINGVDQELEMLELKKANLLAAWEKEWDVVMLKRKKIAMEREGVRKRFKRLSMGVSGTMRED
jgi:hypothetical protein